MKGGFGVSCHYSLIDCGLVIVLLSLPGNSYARWTLTNDIGKRLQLQLSFRTKQADAVLMDARGDRDYSTLEIVNGRLQVTYKGDNSSI